MKEENNEVEEMLNARLVQLIDLRIEFTCKILKLLVGWPLQLRPYHMHEDLKEETV
jgi:hypothetical protein